MAAGSASHRSMAYLDGIRSRDGVDGLRREFHAIAGGDREKAAGMINDPAMRFPSLFVLHPVIIKHDLFEHLNNRNRFALDITGGVLAGSLAGTYKPEREHHADLRWMLDTGHASDGLSDQYDEVVDKVALLLTRVYGDRACLRTIEDLIFQRHRKGAYIYDLVWAYFESSEPRDLVSLAHRLNSRDARDAELARKLLNFIPCVESGGYRSPERLQRCAAEWLRRNQRRLQYTGESTQMNGNPRRYALGGGAREGGGGHD